MKDEIAMLPVDALTAHPFLAEDPMMDEASEDWLLLVDDIANNGIEHALTVYEEGPQGYILGDGRHRLKAAIEAGMLHVPCKLVSPERLLEFMLRSESVRKNRSKTAQAWRAAVFYHPFAEENKVRRSNLPDFKKSQAYTDLSLSEITDADSIARSVGITKSMLQKAHWLRFVSLPECEYWLMPDGLAVFAHVNKLIYDEGAGINAVADFIKGVKGAKAGAQNTPDGAEKCARRGHYVASGWAKTFRHLEFWESFPKDQKQKVMEQAPELAEKLPKEVRTVMIAKLMELERKGI